MSSLEMAGVSLSVLSLDDERLRLLDAPTLAPAWPTAFSQPRMPISERVIAVPQPTASSTIRPPETPFGKAAEHAIESACSALILAEERLTELDRIVGDGDLGLNMSRAARAVKQELPAYRLDDPSATLRALAGSLRQHLGGSSGPLYGILFLRAAMALEECPVDTADAWADAAIDACEAVSKLGGAQSGDRTMLDALIPFATTFRMEIGQAHSIAQALRAAVEAAETGAQATANMHPRRSPFQLHRFPRPRHSRSRSRRRQYLAASLGIVADARSLQLMGRCRRIRRRCAGNRGSLVARLLPNQISEHSCK